MIKKCTDLYVNYPLCLVFHVPVIRKDTQMKFYKVVARPSLVYGSETWVTMQRDMTGLEVAEVRLLRSVTGYTRLDKI